MPAGHLATHKSSIVNLHSCTNLHAVGDVKTLKFISGKHRSDQRFAKVIWHREQTESLIRNRREAKQVQGSIKASSSLQFGAMPAKEELKGTLVRYGEKSVQVAFITGDFKRHVVFVGGLGDGLLATKFIEPLAHALLEEKWSLVQPLLSSSYSGWGTASLDQDAEELELLLRHLSEQGNSEGVVLIGHSTGCQDVVHLLRSGSLLSRGVRAVILQAPVSDREYLAGRPQTAEMLQLASRLIAEGKGQELMPREADVVPITAYRFHSLAGSDGDDDLFSSDLRPDELEARLGHMAAFPCMVLFSGADECVPAHVDKTSLLHSLATAMGGAREVLAPDAGHSLTNWIADGVATMVDFIKEISTGRNDDDPWK